MKMASRSQPRKGARFHRLLYIFRPSGLGIQRNRFTPGWCPGLHSYAAPRLGCCDIKSFHASSTEVVKDLPAIAFEVTLSRAENPIAG